MRKTAHHEICWCASICLRLHVVSSLFMMEFAIGFTKSQIAGLVLGYLKSEKCFGGYNAFLESSAYFQENRQSIKSGKCFATRVMGKCLIDFLEEYANVYSIVQARLEASNYYDEKHPKDTLLDQIIYLLDNTGNIGNISPVSSATSEVETTPAHTLPGNHCHKENDFYIQKTPNIASSSAPEVETSPSSAVRNLGFSTPAVNSAEDKTELEKRSEKIKVWDPYLRSPTLKRKRSVSTKRTSKKTKNKEKTSVEEKLENASDAREKKDTEVEYIVEKTPPEREIPVVEQLIEESPKNESDIVSNLNVARDTEVIQTKVTKLDLIGKKNSKEVLKNFNNTVIRKKTLNLSSYSSDSDTSGRVTWSKTPIIYKKDENERISEIKSTVPAKTILTNKLENQSQRSQFEVVRQRTMKIIQDTAQPTQKPNRCSTNKSSKKVTNAKVVTPKNKSKVLKDEETKKLPVASKGKNAREKKETFNDETYEKAQKLFKETYEEAEKLVKDLAQRGRRLIFNKTPTKNENELLKNQKVFENQVEETRKQTVGESDQNINLFIDERHAVFDKQTYSDCIDFVFNEKSPSKKKTLNDYDFQCLTKTFKDVVFVEELNTEVERNMKWSSFELLADLPLGGASSMKNGQINDDVYDELMDFAVSGGDSGVAEKIAVADKPVDNAEYILNKLLEIGVHTFLDKVHGF